MNFANLRGKIFVSIALGIAVVLVLGISADAPTLARTLAEFRWQWIPAILALTLVNYGLRFVKWQFFLRTLGIGGLDARRSGLIFVSGMAMTVTPGKVGEWLKSFLLKEATGTPVSASAPVILAERLSDGLAMVILASGGLILYGYGWQTLAVAVVGGGLVVAVSQYRPLARWSIGLACRIPFLARRLQQVEAFYESAKAILHWRCLGVAIGIGVVSWAAEGVAFYLVLIALGMSPTPALLFQAIFVLSASTIVGALSMLPGGLAVAEGSIAGLLLLLKATDSPAVAAAATIVIRFATLWFGVSLGVVALSVFSRLDIARWQSEPRMEAEEGSRPR
jgi:glycosyltransferase 2 family protein